MLESKSKPILKDLTDELYYKIKNEKLSEVIWRVLSRDYKLSEDIIREFQNEVMWGWISDNQELSESFIIEFQDKVNWHNIVTSQKLSEKFLRENKDILDRNKVFHCTFYCQNVSEDFIREFQDKLDWMTLVIMCRKRKLSFEFIIEFVNKVTLETIDNLKNNEKINFTEQQYATIENLSQMHGN